MLMAAFRRGDLSFHGQLASGRSGPLRPLRRTSVGSQVGRLRQAYLQQSSASSNYLGRYTPRRHLKPSHHRHLRLHVSFRWKGTTTITAPEKIMTITVDEFIRRYVLHVLPVGLSPHPLLRPSRQLLPRREPRPHPSSAWRHRPCQPIDSSTAERPTRYSKSSPASAPTVPNASNGRSHHRDHPEPVSICRVVSDRPEPTRRASTDPPRLIVTSNPQRLAPVRLPLRRHAHRVPAFTPPLPQGQAPPISHAPMDLRSPPLTSLPRLTRRQTRNPDALRSPKNELSP
ncbi:MAG: transposase [Blastocatellia bacterium]|nr:transposase [Blastocatellia bacterium]